MLLLGQERYGHSRLQKDSASVGLVHSAVMQSLDTGEVVYMRVLRDITPKHLAGSHQDNPTQGSDLRITEKPWGVQC